MASPPHFLAHPLPPSELRLREAIRFLHPGYSTSNTLLSLPRVDRIADTTTFGVHYGTALLACQIIADNAFDTGHLTLDEEGQQPVNLSLDDILTERVYYFFVGDRRDRYPIVPSFQDWEFPHDRIPDSWPQVPASLLSNRCGISNYSFTIEEAHLIPQEENLWYSRNNMRRYGSEILQNIDDSANILPLKVDLHRCFDKRWFAIIPKAMKTTAPHSPQYVSHILSPEASELWPTYHNTVIQYLDAKARPYLFTRFAWAILLLVKPFVIDGISRHVIRIQMSSEDSIVRTEMLLSGPQLRAYYGGGGTKRATPTNKRSGTGTMADDDANFVESSSEDGDFNMDNGWEIAMDEWKPKENERRQISSETAVEEDNQGHMLAELKARLQEVLPRGGDGLA